MHYRKNLGWRPRKSQGCLLDMSPERRIWFSHNQKKKSQVPMRWDSNSVEDRRMQGEEKKKKTVGRERKKADRETWAIEGITDVLNIQGRSSWWRRRLTTQEYRIEQVINNVISLGWGFVKDFEDCKEKKENLNWKRELFKYVEGRERLRFLL